MMELPNCFEQRGAAYAADNVRGALNTMGKK